ARPRPAPAPQRLQGPVVDVPVAPGSREAQGAPTVAVPAPGGWGSAPTAPPAPVRPAPPPVVVSPYPPLPGPYAQPRRPSLADMANAQLRRGTPRDPLAANVEDAAVQDCLHAPDKPGVVGGLLNAPVVAARALSGRCPK
ncbi:hypothetical protein IM725_18470, partial [Ramlibacter aquaticus]|nr:hypothetical protein [Ramlibacter aquaticus]